LPKRIVAAKATGNDTVILPMHIRGIDETN
jgi:hypothetical protein